FSPSARRVWYGSPSEDRGFMRLPFRLAVVTLLWTAASTATAQPAGTLNRFGPSETPEDDFHLSRPTDLGHLRFGAQIHADYALNPLVYERILGEPSSESHAVVRHQLTGTLGLSLGLADRLVIYAGLPVVLLMRGDRASNLPGGVVAADGFGLGDTYL